MLVRNNRKHLDEVNVPSYVNVHNRHSTGQNAGFQGEESQ
jgi:hypothetical protein